MDNLIGIIVVIWWITGLVLLWNNVHWGWFVAGIVFPIIPIIYTIIYIVNERTDKS